MNEQDQRNDRHNKGDFSASEAKLRAILSTAVEGIVTITKTGIIESMNASALVMFGYEAEEAIGKNVNVLMPPPYQMEHDGYLARYVNTGEKRIVGIGREVLGLRKNGSTFPMYLSVGEVWVDNKWYFTGIVRDLTEQKRVESRAASFGRIIEDTSNEIYIFDTVSLRFIRVNRGARENLGYSMEELRQMTPLDLNPDFDSLSFSALVQRLKTGEEDHVRLEAIHLRKDGTQYPVEASLHISDHGGAQVFVAITVDTTERHKSQERIAGFGRIMEESLNEVYIFDAKTHQFMEVNRGARKNMGYTLEELRGLTPLDIKPEFSPARFEKLIAPLRNREKEKVEFRTVHRRKDGSLYDVEVHLQLARWDSRQVFLAIILDITERRKMVEQLEESEQRYRQMIETSHDMIQSCSPDGHLLFVNQSWLRVLKYEQADISCLQIFDIIHLDHLPHCREMFNRVLTGESVRNVETVFVAKDGTSVAVEGNVTGRYVGDGLIATHGFFRDITERKKAEQAQRLAAVGETLAGIAHESRNALQRIQSGIDMLQDELAVNTQAGHTLGRIQRASDDLHGLLETVREYSAPIILKRSVCDLSQVWRKAWSDLETMRQTRDAELYEFANGVDLDCEIDATRIEQVFRNLFENSIFACSDPTHVKIDCQCDAHLLKISVCDNGPGLSPDARHRVFDAFYTTKTRGTGLGMPIVKRLIEAHGGQIGIGECSAQGAEFVITLPRTE